MLNAVNAERRVVVDYGEDPHAPGRGILHEVWLRLAGFLVPVYAGGDVDPETQFHGYGPALQNFQGAASPATTGVVYNSGGYAELSSGVVEGAQGDAAARIFADRLRRRSA